MLSVVHQIGAFKAGMATADQLSEAMTVLEMSDEEELKAFVDMPIGIGQVSFLPNYDDSGRIVWKPAADATIGDIGLMAITLLWLLARVAHFADITENRRPILTLEDAAEKRDEGPVGKDLSWFATQNVVGWQDAVDWDTHAYTLYGAMCAADDVSIDIRLYSES